MVTITALFERDPFGEQAMPTSSCTVSFFRNDLQRTRLQRGMCPVKNCKADIGQHKVPFHRYRGKMRYLPFCPEHGIRIHPTSFVYYNGPSDNDLAIATRRNLMFNADYYISNFFKKAGKAGELWWKTKPISWKAGWVQSILSEYPPTGFCS